MHLLDHFKYCPKCGSTEFNIIAVNAKKCTKCGFEHYKNPTPATAVLAFDSQDRLLCVRRAKEPGKGLLCLPGGFIELNETAEDAAVREAWEETGIKVAITGYLGSIPNQYIYNGIEQSPLDFYYSGKIVDDSHMKCQEGETSDILFIPRAEINVDDFAFRSIRVLLKRILGK